MTTRYALRHVRPDDARAVLDAFASAPDMARQGEVVDLSSAQEYVEWLRGPTRRAIATAHDDGTHPGRMVGLVAIGVDDVNRNGWVFYWTHAAHRGLGVTARAVATVASWALGDGGLERLEVGHRVDNPASGAVALAAGFVQEGRERGKFLVDGERVDVLTYGRLPSDPWPATQPLAMQVEAAPHRSRQPRDIGPHVGPSETLARMSGQCHVCTDPLGGPPVIRP